MKELTHLSLFTGIGGLDLAAEWSGFQTVGQCEFADYPTKVLEKQWPDTPRWRDIRTLTGGSFYERTGRRTVDIISGGFPCQPFSVAGKQRSTEDDRYLWPEMVRVIKELRPTWIVGENVAGIVRMALPDILSELEGCGYRTRTFLIPACAVGARHRRYRVAIIARAETMENTDCFGRGEPENVCEQPGRAEFERTGETMADTESELWNRSREAWNGRNGFTDNGKDVAYFDQTGLQGRVKEVLRERTNKRTIGESSAYVPHFDNGGRSLRRNGKLPTVEETGNGRGDFRDGAEEYEPGERRTVEPGLGGMADGISDWLDGYWDIEPDIPRIAQGIPNRVCRLKALGNAVVPQQFYPIFKAIAGIERRNEDG